MTATKWPEVPFDDVLVDVSAGQRKTKTRDFLAAGAYPLVDQGKELVGGYSDDPDCLSNVELPVVVFGDHTRTVKYIDFPFGVGADGVKLLRPRAESDPAYLYRFLQSVEIPAAGYDRHFKYLKRISIPLPPLEQQRRIATVLDQADALRAKRRDSLDVFDSLRESTFLDLFGDPISNTRGWSEAPLGAVATTTSGGTPDRSRADYFGGGIPWVKSGELVQGDVDTTEETLTKDGLAGSSAKLLPAGTVLIAMYGATAGAVSRLRIEAATNQAVCSITPQMQLNAEYLITLLKILTPTLLDRRVGGAQPNLTQGMIRDLVIPVPPLDLQHTFGVAVEGVRLARHSAHRSNDEFDELFASLQQRAFRGDL